MAVAYAYNVLFLCTGNSARSIMAEAILNKRRGLQRGILASWLIPLVL